MKFPDNRIDEDRGKSHATAWDLPLYPLPDVSYILPNFLIDNGIYPPVLYLIIFQHRYYITWM